MRAALLDTHVWLWLAADEKRLSVKAAREIERCRLDGGLYVSILSVWETAVLVRRDKLRISRPVDQWVDAALQLPGVILAPLTPVAAVESTRLPDGLGEDPVDRILVATARELGIPIVTKDSLIRDYPHVKSVW